jgi:hypothetical protein
MSNPRIAEAIALMQDFAERTGLSAASPPRRYLWTDAFAVCNYLGLARATREHHYTTLALRLVDQVHHTLGRHRDDDPRTGWLSGLDAHQGELHPTRGGLRIGKGQPERGPDQPLDERLEWDRDGQYFHYLTKWMHALDQVTHATGQPGFNLWARELAKTAFDTFTYLPAPSGPRRMVWKMSIDLTRPLVPAMGQHDPLDGYITCRELLSTAAALSTPFVGPKLGKEISQFADMLDDGEWTTADPLGIGGLLTDAFRVAGLLRLGAMADDQFLENLLAAALAGLQDYADNDELHRPAECRLAFRELGLAIGLHAVEYLLQSADSETTRGSASPKRRTLLQALLQFAPMAGEIESFWRNPEHCSSDTWSEHRDINEVMLATSLVPEGFLIKNALPSTARS